MTIPPFPRHFVTVLAFSQSRDRAGALGTGPRCAGAGGPHGPGPRSPPPPRRRTWERGRSRDPRPPPAPSHRHRPAPLRAPRTQQPRVVAGWVHAGPSHAGPAPVSGPLSPGERARSAVASLPSRRAGDAGPVASLRPPHGYRKRPDGREGEHTPCRREWSAPGPGSPGTASFSPARSRWRCRAPRGTSPNALAGSPRGRRRAVRGPRQVGRPVGADSPVSPAGRAARGREAAGTSRGAVPVAAGTGGRDGGCPDGAGRSPSTRAGTDERRRQRPTGGHSGWVRVPLPTAAFPGRGGLACGTTRETRARRRLPPANGSEARRGRSAPRVGPPEPSGGGGRRRERGRRGLLQCCNAAPRRAEPAAPAALRRCSNAGVSTAPRRAEPGRASRAPPDRPRPQPRRASALPRFLAPVSFSSRSCRDGGTFPLGVPGTSPSPTVCRGGGGGGASSCPRRRRPGGHAGSHPRPLSSPASGRGSPRRRDCCEAPGAAPIRGGSPGSALLRSSFSWGKLPPPHVTSGPPPGAPHPRRRPSRSFAPSPLSPPRGPAANSAVCPTRDPRRGRGVPPPLPYPAAGI